ncbi:MAG: hypothetical protein KBF89_04370 [Acidimicrobiia bacterium]|nr:hypothetical protein [Acidimicrobiia bacterium]
MNKQLQLLEQNSIKRDADTKVKSTTKKPNSRRKTKLASVEKPWKLSESERNQGLAGIAMIKQILASMPNNFDLVFESDYAKAS